MSRLVLFLFGVLVGAAGVFFLINEGWLQTQASGPAIIGDESRAPGSVPVPTVTGPSDVTPAPPEQPAYTPPPVAIEPLPIDPPAGVTAVAPELSSAPSTGLAMPVLGIKPEQLTDTYTQSRGAGRSHDAIDVMAPRGTPVVAVDDGRIAKLFTSVPGGLTLYQFDRDEKLAYYYAHLDSYAPGVAEGKPVKRGELIGYVGFTGNANPAAPHLHFAVFVLGPEKSWWKGAAVNPYPLLGGRAPATQLPGDATHAGQASR